MRVFKIYRANNSNRVTHKTSIYKAIKKKKKNQHVPINPRASLHSEFKTQQVRFVTTSLNFDWRVFGENIIVTSYVILDSNTFVANRLTVYYEVNKCANNILFSDFRVKKKKKKRGLRYRNQ